MGDIANQAKRDEACRRLRSLAGVLQDILSKSSKGVETRVPAQLRDPLHEALGMLVDAGQSVPKSLWIGDLEVRPKSPRNPRGYDSVAWPSLDGRVRRALGLFCVEDGPGA